MSPEVLVASAIATTAALAFAVWLINKIAGREINWAESIFEILVGLIFGVLAALFIIGR